MSDYPAISFHYFDLRGRGQLIRGFLHHHQVPFTDERIVLAKDNSNWPVIRQNRDLTGDFQKLPFILWGDTRLNEVLVILDFLDRKLGNAAHLNDLDWLQHRQLASSAFLDLLVTCINLIWSNVFHPQANLPATTAIVKKRMQAHLITMNQTLEEWDWIRKMADRPVMASDAVLWEALDVIRLTFNDQVRFDALESLSVFYAECAGAESFKALLARKVMTITGRPGEAEALLVIHNSLTED
ncbi:MAG: hypothetical protein P8M72_07375 [Gammaproteobacteria bacterium]|nr:hypothetical protein [Gammaproteobacteria bacterium]